MACGGQRRGEAPMRQGGQHKAQGGSEEISEEETEWMAL